MNGILRLLVCAAGLLVWFPGAGHAQQYQVNWVATTGSDSNDCYLTTPCRSFSHVLTKTATNGVITCLDSGTFGGLAVNRSLTINCNGGKADSGITVTTAATDRVVLTGFVQAAEGPIVFNGAGSLIVDGVTVNRAAAGGLQFTPNGPGKLVVSNSRFLNAGNGTTGAGILVKPAAGGSAQVTLNGLTVSGNTFGIAVDGTGSTAGINVTIRDSVLGSNTNDGVIATTPGGGAPIGVLLASSASTNNGYGVRSIGSNVTVRVDGSRIAGNGTALAASNGGVLLSARNNLVQANGAHGAFTGSVALE
jgi:hypothetical protein